MEATHQLILRTLLRPVDTRATHRAILPDTVQGGTLTIQVHLVAHTDQVTLQAATVATHRHLARQVVGFLRATLHHQATVHHRATVPRPATVPVHRVTAQPYAITQPLRQGTTRLTANTITETFFLRIKKMPFKFAAHFLFEQWNRFWSL